MVHDSNRDIQQLSVLTVKETFSCASPLGHLLSHRYSSKVRRAEKPQRSQVIPRCFFDVSHTCRGTGEVKPAARCLWLGLCCQNDTAALTFCPSPLTAMSQTQPIPRSQSLLLWLLQRSIFNSHPDQCQEHAHTAQFGVHTAVTTL